MSSESRGPANTPTGLRLRGRLQAYGSRLRLFRPNARFYLLFTAISGAALGIYRLLYNFYVLSLGYDEALLGRLLTTTSLVALLSALPAGYLSDRVGRKPALLLSSAMITGAVAGIIFLPSTIDFYTVSALIGLGQSLVSDIEKYVTNNIETIEGGSRWIMKEYFVAQQTSSGTTNF